ncbi:retrovirus-related pol polyprotein from transposon TNT 1-94, partial [Tanacetum coccineum]
ACPQPQSVPQIEYTISTVNQQTHLAEFPQIDSGLIVPVFKQGDDPIDAINKMMSILSTVVTSRQQRVVKCFNCQREGHIARQCPKPKRKRDAMWFREKVLLVEAQGNGKVLNEEELEFLADPGIAEAQQISPMLYDGNVIVKETNMISITNSEETLMLEEESRSEMLLKQSDLMVLEKKVNTKPIDYAELNRLSKDFGKRLCPHRETAPQELPKITPNALTEEEWGFEHTKAVFQNEIIPFLKTLKDIFNVFDKDLLNEVTKVQIVFNQMEVAVQQELIKQHNMVEKDEYNRLLKRFFELKQHCISLEIAMQLNKEIFQKNNTSVNQTEPSLLQWFEINNLSELQAKDTTIKKLKAHIKRVNETSTNESVKKDLDEIKTLNIELEHRVTKLIAENEHLKQTYKQLYDSIKPSRVRAKEQTESLVNQVNQKSVEISDLNAQLQEKVFVITTLKNDLRKLKGKDIVDNAAQMSNVATIAPGMYKLDPIILAPMVKNNREAHEYYLKHTINKKMLFCNIPKVTNRPLLSSTRVKPSTSASGSKPLGNTKNDRISRTPSSNEKNKVEVQSRKVKSKLNKQNSDSKNIYNEHVKHPIKGAQALCSVCNECLFDANHAMCLIDYVNSMNVRDKSASKKNKKRKEWKPTGKVFNSVGYKWKPTMKTNQITYEMRGK